MILLLHKLQYSELAAEVQKGRGRIPVADYKIVKSVDERDSKDEHDIAEQSRSCYSFCMCPGGQVSHLPLLIIPPSVRARLTYCVFFNAVPLKKCMQVVLTSTDPSELCINGMSFSRRASKWANSALVVTVSAHDFKPFESYGPLAGVEFQVLITGIHCETTELLK